jgi:glutamine synthetase
MFIGDELAAVLDSLENDKIYEKLDLGVLDSGVSVLPNLPKDTTDRNRTSPFAFTGNKFEFRMLGSGFSLSCTNSILNSIVADSLGKFADVLEKVSPEDFNSALNDLLKSELKAHKRIVFNGNNYSADWVVEAEKRGLLNLKTTADALPHYTDKKNVEMFERQGIYTYKEMLARQESILEEYYKVLHIEAQTMLDMASTEIAPAVLTYSKELADTILAKKQIGISAEAETKLLTEISDYNDKFAATLPELKLILEEAEDISSAEERAKYYRDNVLPKMQEMRAAADKLETLTAAKYWPFPTYGELMFY